MVTILGLLTPMAHYLFPRLLQIGRHLITGLDALNSIADKAAGMKLHAVYGTVESVNSSMLSGSGVVAPEPISMLLVGAGMAGLPLAGRFRRFRRFVRKMCRLKPGQP